MTRVTLLVTLAQKVGQLSLTLRSLADAGQVGAEAGSSFSMYSVLTAGRTKMKSLRK